MKHLIIALVFAVGIISPAWAQTQTICTTKAEMAELLWEQYNEQKAHTGLTVQGALVEVFVSEDDKFTIVLTTPQGFSCFLSNGNNWKNIIIKKGKKL